MADDFENIGNGNDLPDDWAGYEPPTQFRRPPDAGVYPLQRDAEAPMKAGIATTKDGQEFVWYNFRSKIQGGPSDGSVVFGGCNTMASKFRQGTSLQDFIFSGKSAIRPTAASLKAEALAQAEQDPKSYVIERVNNFTAKLDWEWRCKDCEETFFKGQSSPKIPKRYVGAKPTVRKDKAGKTDHIQVCPGCKAEVGANAVIVSFIVPRTGTVTVPAQQVVAVDLPPAAG